MYLREEAETQLRALVADYYGRDALEELVTECLSRLAEQHGMYLCEAQYEEVEFDLYQLYHKESTRRAVCSACEWPEELHIEDDYLCLNCRAVETYFPDRSNDDYSHYTSKAKDADGNVLYLEDHSRWSSAYGHLNRYIIYVRQPIPDSYMPACRPLNTLAYEFLQYKADTLKPDEKLPF